MPGSLETIEFGRDFNQPIGENVLPNSLKDIKFERNYIEIDVRCLPPSLKYLFTSNTDIALSLNPESQRMWFSVILVESSDSLDVTYPTLRESSCGYNGKYKAIGTETIDGKKYDKVINPEFYQPRSNAKSARK